MFSGEVSSDLYKIKKGDINLYDYGNSNDMYTGYLIVRFYTHSGETYNPNNLTEVAKLSNDNTHQLGAGYTYIVNPASSEVQKCMNALNDYAKYGSYLSHAVLMFFAIQTNSGALYPLYYSGTPYIKLYSEYKLFANARVSTAMYRTNSIGFNGNVLQSSIKLSGTISQICFGLAFRVNNYVSGIYTIYSRTNTSTLTGTHRFRLVQFAATSSVIEYQWYADIYDTRSVKQTSVDINYSSTINASFCLVFDRDYLLGRYLSSTLPSSGSRQMAIQYSGDSGAHWMNVKEFTVSR